MRTVHNLEASKSRRKRLRNNSTPQEILLWSRLKGKQLGFKFRRQHGIGHYITDFCCPERRIIIELDGSQHAGKHEQMYDEKRSEYLHMLGYTVLRFWDNEVTANIDGVLLRIEQVCGHTTP